MKTAQVKASAQDAAREYTNLDRQYGQIGISAVAAAVRYQTCERPSPVAYRHQMYLQHED